MREMSVTEQRYKAVLAVIGDGRTVSEVATDWGVSRRTMHRWLVRYEGDELEGLNNGSHWRAHCPHQMLPAGSSPWSNSRLDLIQMLASVIGPHRVERAGLIQARKKFIR
jgi:leucine-zipper of insertion element IS481